VVTRQTSRAIARITLAITFLAFVSFAAAPADRLPRRISDAAFWQMISNLSEPGGSFPYDNFVSNETLFQRVIPELKKSTAVGGVYLGVGPEQNFTYIAALHPRIAFIIDIRRQNMIEQLMHKALIEMSANRAEYLSRLFSRKRPSGIHGDPTAAELFQSFAPVAPDPQLFTENLQAIKERLIRHHGFKLTDDDQKSLEFIYDSFFRTGPSVTYVGARPPLPDIVMPTFEDLMTQTDPDGVNRSYLGNEESFRIVRNMEQDNLIVPLVGDFAGPKTLRAVGQYLKDNGAAVSTIYASNVEQYLFPNNGIAALSQQNDNWKKYYWSLETLPFTPSASFIRTFNRFPPPCPKCVVFTVVCPITDMLQAFNEGRIKRYEDVLQMSH
jgi:hypothetical protein